jgi:hypothetical protein
MSPLIHSRLESTIAGHQDLIQQLCRSSSPTQLDALYTHVLSTCCEGDQENAGKVLGTVVLLDANVTPSLLAALLQLPQHEVTAHVQALIDAQLLKPDGPSDSITDTTNLRICHDSLRGFVVDPLRCQVKHYIVNTAEDHEKLSNHCLSLLNNHLRHDICDIRNHGLANADVPNLSARIVRSVPEAVRYACLSWPIHLIASGSVSRTVSVALLQFCTHHLLHWLEVLSLLGELSRTAKYLPEIMKWCQVSTSPSG